ncbi:MAG: hypothetical protein JWO38_3342 [Gemmataceae bacterium]|nr:hypothetical protein [Gemmataceae bacterium]
MVAVNAHEGAPSPGESAALYEFLEWLAQQARVVAHTEAEAAERAEALTERFLFDRRSRVSLRGLARQNRRAAWQHLELALKAEKLLRGQAAVDLEEVLGGTTHPV